MEIQDHVLFLEAPEEIPEKEPGEPENIGAVFDAGYLADIISRLVIDIYGFKTVCI